MTEGELPARNEGVVRMTRFLMCVALVACVAWRARRGRAAAPSLSRRKRHRSRLRHRDRSRRPARHDADTGQLRGARRRQAAADHAVRQHAPADSTDRHAGCLGQHGRQPAAAPRRRRAALRAASSRTMWRASARSATRSRSARRSRTIPDELAIRAADRRSRRMRRRRSGARSIRRLDAFSDGRMTSAR